MREQDCNTSAIAASWREGRTDLADALENSKAVPKVADVEHGHDELDVRVVANAVGKAQSTRLALARLVARPESLVEHAALDGGAVLDVVQVPLVRLVLRDGHNLLRREHGELDVFAAPVSEKTTGNGARTFAWASSPARASS